MTSFNAVVEIDLEYDKLTEPQVDELIDRFLAYHPALGRGDYIRSELVLTVPAEDLRQATDLTFALLGDRDLLPKVTAVHVLRTEDFDRRNGLTPQSEFVSVAEAGDILGVSRQRILQRIAEGQIPAERIGTTWGIRRRQLTEESAL